MVSRNNITYLACATGIRRYYTTSISFFNPSVFELLLSFFLEVACQKKKMFGIKKRRFRSRGPIVFLKKRCLSVQ